MDDIQNNFSEGLKLMDNPLVHKGIQFLVIFVILMVASSLIKSHFVSKINDSTLRYKSRKVISMITLVLLLIIGVFTFGEDLKDFAVSFGIIGASIAFALQETISSFFAWFVITFSNTYSTGDRIQINGIYGDVIDINFQTTTLMECGSWVKGDLYNGRIVRVANNSIFKQPLFNYNKGFPFLWDEVSVPVKYGSNIEQARAVMEKVADEILGDFSKQAKASWKEMTKVYLIEDARIEPFVSMVADENWITFTLRYVTNYTQRRSTKDKLYSEILKRFELDEVLNIASTAIEITQLPNIIVENRSQGDKS